MENNQEIVAIATITNNQPGTSICSIKPEAGNVDQAKIVYNAMNNPDHKIADFINKKIIVENYFVEIAEILDEDTGVMTTVPRTVLISPDGESYMANSKGIFNSIRNAVTAFGDAPWHGGIAFEVLQQKVGRGNMLTLKML